MPKTEVSKREKVCRYLGALEQDGRDTLLINLLSDLVKIDYIQKHVDEFNTMFPASED